MLSNGSAAGRMAAEGTALSFPVETQQDGNRTALDDFKVTCHKHMVMSNDEYIDVVFGVVLANRLDSKPVWLYLVIPPGGGKTEVLQALDGPGREIYALSILTPQTLISGQILKRGQHDPSLLPKLDGKTLVLKDFTAMLTGKWENLNGRAATEFHGFSRG